ncbi:MAG TPA: alpha-glucuronidase family glycosyl hydrolase [Verrucomicrobiae bacterium]
MRTRQKLPLHRGWRLCHWLSGITLLLLICQGVQAEDGYRLWLRYELINDPAQRERYLSHTTEVVAPTNSPTQRVIRDELARGLSGLLGEEPRFASAVSSNGTLLVGTPANNPAVAALNWGTDLKRLGEDGYIIRSVTNSGQALIVIASDSEVGSLYGTFDFLRRLQTRRGVDSLAITEQPALKRRLLDQWDNLNGSVERGYAGKSLWKWEELPGKLDPRYADYARANASLGLNGIVLNNVNAKPEQLSTENLTKAAALADVFRPYGIHLYLTANFASPKKLGGLKTANPQDPEVRKWWRDKADEIYSLIPDFGGFLVKANSEGQPGPQDYGLTHADGANPLAEALAPHGGIVMWRAFVYNRPKVDKDRSKRAYLEFQPLDGKFQTNVFIQVKNGPIDFQPREPFNPLFGAMHKTSLMAELEITLENMGHATDLVYLAPMWKEFLESDTQVNGPGSTVAKVLDDSPMTAMAGVANTGQDRNWCGHDFAQANWYAFGRLAWNSDLSAAQIAEEWTRMTWSNDPEVITTITNLMLGSWEACVNYEMPLGLHHIMEAGGHYDPAPQTRNQNTPEYSGWYYHKADEQGIGFDRTASGSDAVAQYALPVNQYFSDLSTCPPELLLWFHHVNWDYQLKNGRTVWQELCFRYNDGVEYVKTMQSVWETLQGRVDAARFKAVQEKLKLQLKHATNWRDTCIRFFQSVNHRPLPAYLDKTPGNKS